MQCNLCNTEMKQGFLPIQKGKLYWFPKSQNMPWNVISVPKGSILLKESAFFGPFKIESYYCPKCRVVVTPVPNNIEQKY